MTDARPDLLSVFLDGRDVVCPGCGYNLRDLRCSRCPECGEELILRVGLAEPRQAAVIGGFIGLAAGGGLSGLLLAYLVIHVVLLGDSFGGYARFLWLNLGGLVIEGVPLICWLLLWRRIRRLPAAAKLALVAVCWGLTLTNLLVFSQFIK